MKLNKEQIGFLNECTYGKWTINEKTGLVDIKGDFDCSREKLTDFKGVRFGGVTGSFNCHDNKLTSLVGAPQVVIENFYCSNNKLTSLEGAPQEVGGDFWCHDNDLTSLKGAPQKVGGSFYCKNNSISEKTLKLVWETMRDKKIDYWKALCILNSQIPNGYWEEMSRGLDGKLSKDAQKGVSMLDKFRYFD